jgi:D-methionine transport system substrate-binding protein
MYTVLAQYKKLIPILYCSVLCLMLAGCKAPGLKVGTVSGPETELMKKVKAVALQEYGLRVKIVEFSDYHLLNTALQEGGLNANMFQHQAYLEEELKYKGYRLVGIAKTFIYPMGIYSHTLTHLKDLKKGATVAIPNDPTNEGRALRLLEQAGLIKLDVDVGFLATPQAIRYNPKALKFKTLDAAQLIRTLSEVDIAVINTTYSVLADLYPSRDALFTENAQSPYVNLLVVREEDKDNDQLKKLASVFQDEEILMHAKLIFKSQAIPA